MIVGAYTVNTVVELESDLQPEAMLQVCQGIELMLGRPQNHEKMNLG